jgi:hypothetical protein
MSIQVEKPKLTDDPRFESLKLLKEWSSWMVTTEGVMIGFLVNALAKAPPVGASNTATSTLHLDLVMLQYTILAFASSIAMAAWVLGSLPSISQRLHRGPLQLGAYGIFDLPIVRWIPLCAITFLQHLFFFGGLIALFSALPLSREIVGRKLTTFGWMIVLVGFVIAAALMLWWRARIKGDGVPSTTTRPDGNEADSDQGRLPVNRVADLTQCPPQMN